MEVETIEDVEDRTDGAIAQLEEQLASLREDLIRLLDRDDALRSLKVLAEEIRSKTGVDPSFEDVIEWSRNDVVEEARVAALARRITEGAA